MITLIHSKLKASREALKLSQTGLAEASGYTQSGISALENGNYHYVPNHVLTYLAQQGIDLSAMFDDRIELLHFEEICAGRTPMVAPVKTGPCQMCAVKDIIIADKVDSLRRADMMVDVLREKIQGLEGKAT